MDSVPHTHIKKKKDCCGVDTAVNINKKAYGIVPGSYLIGHIFGMADSLRAGGGESYTILHGSFIYWGFMWAMGHKKI